MRSLPVAAIVFAGVSMTTLSASAETRTVGAGKQHATLDEAALAVNPGDVVEVYDDQSWPATVDGAFFKRSGTAAAKITVRGVKNAQGKRPKLSGGMGWTVIFRASHYVFEGFEVTGGQNTCIIHKGNDITIRDSVVHDCPRHGILGTDEESGSLTMQYVEVYKCGGERPGEALQHPVYIATDEDPTTGYPGSVFRMEHCWVHDANNGNNVKSRAQRNEIRYNWIEGAGYYELELIGADGPPPALAREDSEVIGNVFVKTNTKSYAVRIGGDGTGYTDGRYRFLNNTFILTADTGLIRANDGIESLEFSNNVAYRVGGPIGYILRQDDAIWSQGQPRISGANNWFPTDSENIPPQYTGTILGMNPGFASVNPLDVRLSASSPLIDKGTASSPPAPNAAFPNPLAGPEFVPAQRAVPPLDAPPKRPKTGAPDIGAFELGSDAPPGSSSSGAPEPTPPDGATPPGSDPDGTMGPDGCACHTTSSRSAGTASVLAVAAVAYLLRRRRR
jgi:MYXO-CTERM domain-containing protein